MSRRCLSPFPALIFLTATLSSVTTAQERRQAGQLFEAPLPGGIASALRVLEDPTAADRSQFLVEVIRRFHASSSGGRADLRPGALRDLLAHLDAAATAPSSTGADHETVPLPLSPQTWIDTVFGGRESPRTLVAAILRSRNASLLYCGLLSLDGETREWLAAQPDVIAEIASSGTAAFVAAAPGLRVRDARVHLPGGEAAAPAWRALGAAKLDAPAEFIRRIVAHPESRFPYVLGTMAQLPPSQFAFAMQLDAGDPAAHAAGRDLKEAFERAAATWDMEHLPFWRPSLDPALLLGELRAGDDGTPILPGGRAFWNAVFEGAGRKTLPDRPIESRAPVDFGWLSARIFAAPPIEVPQRYRMVVFASRTFERIDRERSADAAAAVRAAGRYPALTGTLERAGIRDAHAFAAAARRADRLGRIEDEARAARSLAQFQGAIALIARAARRGSLPPESLPRLVASLAAVDVNERGDYEGRLVPWLEAMTNLSPGTPRTGSLEARLLKMLAEFPGVQATFAEWEGTRYRVDIAAAEASRLEGLLGDRPRPFVTTARTLVGLAEHLTAAAAAGDRLRALAGELTAAGDELEDSLDGEARAYRDLTASVSAGVEAHDRGRVASAARTLADALLARGLLELTYAVALGQPGAAAISALEAASRHDFGVGDRTISQEWHLPETGFRNRGHWHVIGSLLGLDVTLASFSLTRVSLRPPARKPSLNEADRRVLTQAVSLVDAASLSEPAAGALIEALRRGRARLAAAQSPSDVRTLADELRMSAGRRALLEWTAAHDPPRVQSSLSLSELLSLGMPPAAGGQFDPWGAPGDGRLGCLCLRLDRAAWDPLAGRGHPGTVASRFPDLNLRVAELLAELRMPPALLGSVLAAATVDFVENVNSRDPDDRRGLVEFVQGLTRERVEEYLALLTTDGPLVPVGDSDSVATGRNVR